MTDESAMIAAVDIGNSRIKVGLFAASDVRNIALGRLPEPCGALSFLPDAAGLASLESWLAPRLAAELAWWIGSVERTFATQLVDWLRARQVGQLVMLSSGDLPLAVSLARPDMVGIDRLLDAVAVNHLRPSGKSAVVVDLGTAITVDLISADGAFLGGAILPGIAMAARALHEFTDLLPLLDMTQLAEPPAALGRDTIAAMRSGIYWGAVGGIRRLTEELTALAGGDAQVYLTGGAAPSVAPLIAPSAAYYPHLTLAGIALAAVVSPIDYHRTKSPRPRAGEREA